MTADRPAGGKVLRRRSATREQLIASAEACFLERGFHGASVHWLAAEAGYTAGAIYSSFGDKAGLFLAVLDRRTQSQLEQWLSVTDKADAERQVARMLKQVADDDTWLRWTSAFLEFFAVAIRDPELRSVVSARLQSISEQLERVLEPLTRRSSVPADEFAKLVLAASNGIALFAAAGESTEAASLMTTLLSRLRDDDPPHDRRPGEGEAPH